MVVGGAFSVLILLLLLVLVYCQKHKTAIFFNRDQKNVSDQKVSAIIRDHKLDLNNKSIAIQNKEIARIGQQLHDVIGGNLSFIKLKLSQSDPTEKTLTIMQEQLAETLEHVRGLSNDLISKKYHASAFIEVIRYQMNQAALAHNITIVLYAYPEEELNMIKQEFQVTLFKIIQELLTYSIKYSQAQNIEIHLNKHEDVINLIFEDNGIDFQTKYLKKRMIFQNIKKWVNMLSGAMDFDNRDSKGVIVNINFKLT